MFDGVPGLLSYPFFYFLFTALGDAGRLAWSCILIDKSTIVNLPLFKSSRQSVEVTFSFGLVIHCLAVCEEIINTMCISINYVERKKK